jgi:indole-3-glycerol phosphate synthase
MSILDEIIGHKKILVEERKSLYPIKFLEKSIFFDTKPVSLKHYVMRPDKSGIIAEFKRKSPSKGMINEYADVEQISIKYMQAGASALSVLTDTTFFGGSKEDLETARKFNYCPILQKDFIIDEYQVIEAKSIGADAILLIASMLDKKQIAAFTKKAKSFGLEILFEIHSEEELQKLNNDIDLVGVNNRNLKDFKVDINMSKKLSEKISSDFVKISESGINSPDDVKELRKFGYQGFLIGELFMKSSNPGKACANFISQL